MRSPAASPSCTSLSDLLLMTATHVLTCSFRSLVYLAVLLAPLPILLPYLLPPIRFLIVIISGAIRAIRHPERYGPRAAGIGGYGRASRGQTRAGGLTKAILDTFPIVKFGRGGDEDGVSVAGARSVDPDPKDRQDVEMGDLGERDAALVPRLGRNSTDRTSFDDMPGAYSSQLQGADGITEHPTPKRQSTAPTVASGSGEVKDVAQAAGVDQTDPTAVDSVVTCPICVCDFEEGEDIRVLPCDARHQFHVACVDSWL